MRSFFPLLLAVGCARVPPTSSTPPSPAAPSGDPCSQTVNVDGVNALPLSCPPFGVASSRSPPQPADGLVLPASYSFSDDYPECKHALPTAEQGDCNACWAFSVAGLLSTRVCKARYRAGTTAYDVLSPQMVLSCTARTFPRTNGCAAAGGRPAEALQWMAGHYLVNEACVPYRSTDDPLASQCPEMLHECPTKERFTVSAAGYVIGDEEAMKRAIYRSGPIASILRLSASLHDFAGGEAIFALTKADRDRFSHEDVCDEKLVKKRPIPGYCYLNGKDGARKTRANHVVLVFGWGEDPTTKERYWIVRNWWGEEQYALWGGDSLAKPYGGRSVLGTPPAKPLSGPFLRMKRGIDPEGDVDAAGGLITNPSFLVSVPTSKK